MRMQIPATHKARLRRMRMYPAQHHQLLTIAVVKQHALVRHLARVARALLVRDDEPADEERVGDERPAQHAARLEVALRVRERDFEELAAQVWWEEDGAQGVAVFEGGGGLESVVL